MSGITEVGINFVEHISEELSLEILSNLDRHDLGRFCPVSQKGNRLASDDTLWKKLFPRVPTKSQVKAYLASHTVKTFEELQTSVQEFIHRIPFMQKGTFVCDFPFNLGSSFTATFGVFAAGEQVDQFEYRIFIKSVPDKYGDHSTFTLRRFGYEHKLIVPRGSIRLSLSENLSLFAKTRVEEALENRLKAIKAAVVVIVAAALGRLQDEDRPQ